MTTWRAFASCRAKRQSIDPTPTTSSYIKLPHIVLDPVFGPGAIFGSGRFVCWFELPPKPTTLLCCMVISIFLTLYITSTSAEGRFSKEFHYPGGGSS